MKINPKIYSLLSVNLEEFEAKSILNKAETYSDCMILDVKYNKHGKPVLILEEIREEVEGQQSNHTIVAIGPYGHLAQAFTATSKTKNEENILKIDDIQMPRNIISNGYGNMLMKEIKKQAEKLDKTHITGTMFPEEPEIEKHLERLEKFYIKHGFEIDPRRSLSIKCDVSKWPSSLIKDVEVEQEKNKEIHHKELLAINTEREKEDIKMKSDKFSKIKNLFAKYTNRER